MADKWDKYIVTDSGGDKWEQYAAPAPEVPQWAMEHPNLYGVAEAAKAVARPFQETFIGATKPLVETSAHTLQGLEGIVRGGPMSTYNVPGYGSIEPIQNVGQAVGNALQTSSTITPGLSPAMMGAMFAGGGSIGRNEPTRDVVMNTIMGGVTGKALDIAGQMAMGKKPEQLIREATNAYRKILKPTSSQIGKMEMRGENINKYYKLAAEEGLPIKKGSNDTLDTMEAVEILKNKRSALDSDLNAILEKNNTQFDLKEIGEIAKKNLKSQFKNDTTRKDAAKIIDEYIQDAIEARGEKVLGSSLNDFKQGMWSVSYSGNDPKASLAAKIARRLGFVAKDKIETAYNDPMIKALNQRSGDYAGLERLLAKSHGKSIAGGSMAKYFANTVGSVVGHSTNIPIIGPAVGSWVGGKIENAMTNPEMLSKIAASKMARAMGK